jgi:predicted kinase
MHFTELGFSKAHRGLNIHRIGFVASEITKNGGVAICAPIAPYSESRNAVCELIEQHGSFIETHVSIPLETYEARDRKGRKACPQTLWRITSRKLDQLDSVQLLEELKVPPPAIALKACLRIERLSTVFV